MALDDTKNARELINKITNTEAQNIVISGGGYTGIEIATHLRKFLVKKINKLKLLL